MTDDEIIAVVTARKEGKAIQWKKRNTSGPWYMFDRPEHDDWNFTASDYRVSPRKPREWTVVERKGDIYSKFDGAFKQYIRVREVIEE